MPQLDNWRAYGNQEFYGKYAMIYKEGSPHYTAWVDRSGNIIHEKRYCRPSETSQTPYCYSVIEWSQMEKEILHNNDDNLPGIRNERAYILLDPELNPVFKGKPGDIIRAFDGPVKGYVLLDKHGRVKDSRDAYGKPLLSNATAIILSTVVNYPWCYKLKDGIWHAMNLYPYGCKADFGDYFFQEAVVLAVCDDFLWINGWHDCATEEQPWNNITPPTFFALDWEGNPYPDCPMEQFSDSATFDSDASGRYLHFPTAGEQGPYYYWVEHDGKRGYINASGEWLFVDES